MKRAELPSIANGGILPIARVPRLGAARFRDTVLRAIEDGGRVCALFGDRAGPADATLYAVLADDHDGRLHLCAATLDGDRRFPSLSPRAPDLALFEREVAEQLGLEPTGHPHLLPVRFREPTWPGSAPFRFGRAPDEPPVPGVAAFFRVDGDDVHEVAVGPVHAGVIEPGHFRFQCHGEDVLALEIALGYQHRGVERALVGGPDKRSVHYAETLAGDTTIGHTLAHARLVEALGGVVVPARAQAIRAIALELERLANHTGDLGALANDVAFLPTASFCGRTRGDFLNLTALVCGSRFGRGLVRPGGVAHGLDEARVATLRQRLGPAAKDTQQAARLLWETPSVLARFQDTGTVARATAEQLGLVGPAARAAGLERDVRKDLPFDFYCFAHVPTATWHTGDVFARAFVRGLEIAHSVAFIEEVLTDLPTGPERAPAPVALAPGHLAVSLVEGWRGELVHVALTDAGGRFARYKVVDPSFHNWSGLAMALRGQAISDFPLCNKSFNLSYCGFDL